MIESEALKRSVETIKATESVKESPDKSLTPQKADLEEKNPFEMAGSEEQLSEDIMVKRRNIL